MTPLESDVLNLLGLAYLGGLELVSIYVFFYGTFPRSRDEFHPQVWEQECSLFSSLHLLLSLC